MISLLRTQCFLFNDKVYCIIIKFYYHLTSNINEKEGQYIIYSFIF